MDKKLYVLIGLSLSIVLMLISFVQAAPITVRAFGDYGWRSDDTRDAAGVNLVGLNFTNAGRPGQVPTAADDAAIAQQIKFVSGPGGATYGGAISIDGTTSNSGKSNISTINTTTFFAPASDLVGGSFSATYGWYLDPNPTQRTLAFKIGIQSIWWGTGGGQSQSGFTATRSGESVWDLVLVNIDDSPDSNAWNTTSVDLNNGLWNVYAQAGNTFWTTLVGSNPPAVAQTLAAWQADGVWGPILFGAAANVSSIQFGLGSAQRNCITYLDYLQTTIYNSGDVVDFVGPVLNVNTGETFATIQEAIDDAQTLAGHTIAVGPGTYVLSSTVNVNKANLTIDGAGAGSTIVQIAQAVGYAFSISASGVTLQDIELQKTDVTGVHNLILVTASNVSILNNLIYGPDPGDLWSVVGIVSRAIEISGGLSGILISNNTIHHLRQPAYINPGTSGTISNNAVSGTKGWVIDGANMAFSGNTWPAPINQSCDIALLASVNPLWYPSLIALSNGNNNAYIDAQYVGGEKGRATAYVDDSAPANGDGSAGAPYQLVSLGVGNVLATGTVLASAGNYADELTIAKAMTVTGAGIDQSIIIGPKTLGSSFATIRVTTNAGVQVQGFTVTRDGNNPADWATNPKLIGFAVQGSAGNVEVNDCRFTGNRTAVDLNFTSGNSVHNNVIDFNRSGIVLRNQCPNNSIFENTISGNWTIGVLWLLSSVEDATGTVFFNNSIAGNWYAQIENRSTTGGVKNFSGNWLGSAILTTSAANSTEPGYAALIPIAYGGTAAPPGGAVSVGGIGISDIDFTPWLGASTDTDVSTGNGTNGFQGDFSVLHVDDGFGQYGTANRLQEAVDLVSGSTIYLSPGLYVGQVVVDGFADLNIIGSGYATTTIQAPATAMTHYFATPSLNYAILSIENSASVDVEDLTVDGAGLGGVQPSRFMGVAYRNSGGSITDVSITDVRDNPLNGNQDGLGVYAFCNDGNARVLNLTRVTVTGFQKNGITINGVDVTGNVDECTVIGNGSMGAGLPAQNGVQFGSASSGTLTNSSISNCIYTVQTAAVATGALLLDATSVAVSGNDFANCGIGAYFSLCGVSFNGNTYSANTATMLTEEYYGLYVYSSTPTKSGHYRRTPQPVDFELNSTEKSSFDRASLSPQLITFNANNNIYSSSGDTDSSYAAVVATGGTGDIVFNASGNRATGFTIGFGLYEDAGSLSSVLASNDFLFNGQGLDAFNGQVSCTFSTFANSVNAADNTAGNFYDQNCWSDWPGAGTYAIGGGGGNVDNNPVADCGLDMTPNSIVYNCAGDFTFNVNIGEGVTALDAANIWLEYPAELSVSSVTGLDANFFLAYTQSTNILNTRDTLKVNLGVLSGVDDGPDSLFKVAMNGSVSCLAGDITMIYRDLRDSTNTQIPAPLASPIDFQSNCADPAIVVNSPIAGGFYNIAPVLSLTATDDCDLNNVYYQIDGCLAGGWLPIATGLSGVVYNNSSWSMTGAEFAALTEASHCIRFRVTDDFARENANQCSYTWCFTKDVTAPAPPTTLAAQPGHNKVQLSWVNSGSADVVGVQIQRLQWTDYPDYGSSPTPTPAPMYPANQVAGMTVHSAAASPSLAGNHLDVMGLSNATRDIYYYGAFAYDAAGNYSVAAPSAQARSTSYWLGDIAATFDGSVYFTDLVTFSSSYGLLEGQVGFENDADFGPTHNNSPKGIPLPDDKVEFEDLAIFAINFNNVSPSMSKNTPTLTGRPIESSPALRVVDRLTADGYYVDLYLDNQSNNAKSLIGEVSYNPSRLTFVSSTLGADITNPNLPLFYKPLVSDGKISISAAVLGQGASFDGSGVIATMKFQVRSADAARVRLTRADIRDNENTSIIKVASVVGEPEAIASVAVPTGYLINQNSPNPFNPETSIEYGLPNATRVSIRIYNVIGQLVKTLVDEHQQAGTHEVVWNGTNDSGIKVASGIYFYRFETADFQKTVKMTMLK